MQEYSVVIPAHNASRTIAETLASVVSQSVIPTQIIVVDDGSTDDTFTIAKHFSSLVSVFQQPNKGPAAATNLGLANVRTPIIATVDADDLWHPQKMERQLAVLANDASLHVVCCYQRQFNHGKPDDGSGEVRSGLNRSGIAFRKEVYEQVGDMVDQPGQRGDVVDWLARMRLAGFGFHEIAEVLSYRRIIPGSLSWRREVGKDIGYLSVAHAAMLRNRALTKSRTTSEE